MDLFGLFDKYKNRIAVIVTLLVLYIFREGFYHFLTF